MQYIQVMIYFLSDCLYYYHGYDHAGGAAPHNLSYTVIIGYVIKVSLPCQPQSPHILF